MPFKDPEKHREYMAKRRKTSAKYKTNQAVYRKTDKYKNYHKEYGKKYRQLPEVKEQNKTYRKTEKFKKYWNGYLRVHRKTESFKLKKKEKHKTPEWKKKNRQWRRSERSKEEYKIKRRKRSAQPKNRSRKAKYVKNRRSTDPMFRLNMNVSNSMRNSLKQGKAGRHWEDLIGWKLSDLVERFNETKKPGMSWDNYGKWQWDHKIPISLWRFESPEDPEFKQCWALCNLQPLWAKDNLKKMNKVYAV